MKSANSMYAGRKKKFLLVLPVLVLPFVVFLLWILGLGGPETASGQTGTGNGLNLSLPSAVIKKDSGWSKMQFYEQADEDSMKRRQDQKKDPYYQNRNGLEAVLKPSTAKYHYAPYPASALNQADEEEKAVNEKIAAIHQQLNKKVETRKPVMRQVSNEESSTEVDRLEKMMRTMKEKNEPDSDLIQMNQVMHSIMEVQHPELVQAKLKEQQKEQKVYVVQTSEPGSGNVSTRVEANRFYSLGDEETSEASSNTITAAVQEDQTISDGAVLKMRLTQPVFINGMEIPANQFVYGVAKLGGSRMMVTVKGVQINGDVLPVNLNVFASDGMEGLPAQDAGAKEVLNNSVDQSMQGLHISSVGMNMGAEVAGAAVQAGKSLLKKHIKAVTIEVPAGYAVMLKNVQ